MTGCVRFMCEASRLIVAVCLLLLANPAGAAETSPAAFFEHYCSECHNASDRKGGLDLTSLKTDFRDLELFSRWVKVHDRLNKGEMPPKEAERPPAGEIASVLSWLKDRLIAAERA